MLKDKIKKLDENEFIANPFTFLKWLFIAGIVGIVVGAVGVGFHYAIDIATEFRTEHNKIIFLLPIGGLVIVFLYHICKLDKDKGTNYVLKAVRNNKAFSVFTAPLIFISSTITHLLGGSSGREGAALQLGGSIASAFGRIIKLDSKDERIITMCGMSAAFAALFGTPVTAAIFSMEVASVGVMHFSAIMPCIVSAVVGTKIAMLCGVMPAKFDLSGIPDFTFLSVGKIILLSAMCAALSILFCVAMHKSEKLYSKFIPNRFLRIAAGGVLVVILTLIVGCYDYNGAGMDIVEKALHGEAKYEAFILKIIFTAVTLGAGYKGGEIVPVFFTGATFGNVVGKILNMSPSYGAGIGLISLFCGVTNCPITSVILSVELFGGESIMYFMLSCAISYLLSGYHGLYKEQKIIYSKLKPEFIDQKAQ